MKLGRIINLIKELNHERERNLFFEFHGHTNEFSIRIFKDGWKTKKEYNFQNDYENNKKGYKQAYKDILNNI